MHIVFERIQIDPIDMSTTPDGEYRWILHIVDHFSKFSSSFALRSKHAMEVSEKLALWIGLFGPPHILTYSVIMLQSLAKHPGTSSLKKAVRQMALEPSLTARAASGIRRHTRRIMESPSEPDSDDALPTRAYQELLEAFRQRHCISINLTDGTKLGNGFTELIYYAIAQHYPTLEYL